MVSVLASLALFGAAACTEDEPAGAGRRGAGSPPALQGRILAAARFASRGPGKQIYVHDLASDTTKGLSLPGGTVLDAFWSDSGDRAYVLIDFLGRSRLYRLDPATGRSKPLGPPVRNASAPDLAGSHILTATCGRPRRALLLMDTAGAGRWQEVAPGCVGALSPDGRALAYSPDGRTLWRVLEAGAGQAEKIAELADVAGLEPQEARRARVRSIEWGDGGIALGVWLGERMVPVILTDGGRLELGPADPVADRLDLEWRPGGDELAVATYSSGFTSTEAVIRLFEADSSRSRVVAVNPSGFFEMTWSPEGQFLVATSSSERWVFLDAGGDWRASEHVVSADTYDWAR
jgi:Tol biopolymer transport system component